MKLRKFIKKVLPSKYHARVIILYNSLKRGKSQYILKMYWALTYIKILTT